MREMRRYVRHDLTRDMAVTLEAENVPPSACLVRNLSLAGALLECGPEASGLDLEPGQVVLVRDALGDGLFPGPVRARVVWSYRRFYGVQFDRLVCAGEEELKSWLAGRSFLNMGASPP